MVDPGVVGTVAPDESAGQQSAGQRSTDQQAAGQRSTGQQLAGQQADGQGAGDGRRTPEALLRRLTAIGSPVVLTTALLFYFGWVRAKVQGRMLGYDIGTLPLSTADYVLKSVNLVFVPLMLVLAVALAAQPWHRRLRTHVRGRGRGSAGLLSTLRYAWVALLAFGLGVVVEQPAPGRYVLPLCLTAGLSAWWYGERLTREPGTAPVSRYPVVLVLLVLALFWDAERLASAAGQAYGATLAEHPERLLAVRVLSAHELGLTQPGVTETRMPAADGTAGIFVYDGLRLVDQAGGKYLLMPAGWSPTSGRIVLLREDDVLALEFSDPVASPPSSLTDQSR